MSTKCVKCQPRSFLLTICSLLALAHHSSSLVAPFSSTNNVLLGQHARSHGTSRLYSVNGEKKGSSNSAVSKKKSDEEDDIGMAPICRLVSRADSKLPTSPSILPSSLFQSPHILDKLDAYYHAQEHKRTQTLRYLERASKGKKSSEETFPPTDKKEEAKLVSVVRSSLEDAGFELLSRRDIDLCDSLNVGYLLRLSIVPDVSELDPSTALEFYPERYHANGTVIDKDELLFDGRILVYWRGYSEEVTQGRLLLPKIDYLQASLVQRSAAWVKRILDKVESDLVANVVQENRKLRQQAQKMANAVADSVPVKKVAQLVREVFAEESDMEAAMLSNDEMFSSKGSFKLGRYGGSKVRFVGSPNPTDALDPFTICEVNYKEPIPCPNSHDMYLRKLGFNSENSTIAAAEHDMYEELNHQAYTCEYDEKMSEDALLGMQLLQRVSISNIVDLFSKSGRTKLVEALFEKSELVEPTYEEVVVVWRPVVKEEPVFHPPKFLSEFADILDIEGFEQPPKNKPEPPKGKLEIRNFEGVPMANLPAVLPKTKLIFRPADAFLFDMISFVTFILVASSVRLDSPRLDLLALVSVSLWIFRTVIRYSNKLARYDLLVKKFLTSKISHRNGGALKYLTSEAGSQRAIRAALLHSWTSHLFKLGKSPFQRDDASEAPITRSALRTKAANDINKLLNTDKQVHIDVDRALDDLEDLRLVRFAEDEEELIDAKDPISSVEIIREAWVDILEQNDDEGRLDDRNSTDLSNQGGVSKPRSGDVSKSKGIKQNLSLEQLEERRKRFTSTIGEMQRKGYARVNEVLRDKNEASSLRAPLEGQQNNDSWNTGQYVSNKKARNGTFEDDAYI
jgi:hypothetical protein